jgi:SAM-dependent methyltransferase
VTQDFDWIQYYDEYEDREPRALLLEVLDRFGTGDHLAVDLGCGQGVDTRALLERGWTVVAIDSQEEAIRRVRRRVGPELAERLRTVVSPMEDVELPPADLVWASFSLFFCRPDRLPDVWARIARSVRPGGRFAGQLLGDHDTWAGRDDISSFSEEAARVLFDRDYELERFEEEEKDDEDDDGWKHWHVFHCVGRRR